MKLVKIYKNGCPMCVVLDNLLRDRNVPHESINTSEQPDVIEKYDIMGFPTLLLLNENDEVVERTSGLNVPQINEIIEKIN